MDPYPPIAEYARPAGCHSTALVHRNGRLIQAAFRLDDADARR